MYVSSLLLLYLLFGGEFLLKLRLFDEVTGHHGAVGIVRGGKSFSNSLFFSLPLLFFERILLIYLLLEFYFR